MKDAKRLIAESKDERSDYSALVEDDGRVCWAYLLEGRRIVADVWLYNRGPAPADLVPDRERPPLNPAKFATSEVVVPLNVPEEVVFRWVHEDMSNEISVDIILRGVLFGRLTPGAKPGWARLALRDGPCARVLGE